MARGHAIDILGITETFTVVRMDDTMTGVGCNAFDGCNDLTEVYMLAVTSIEDSAFACCENLVTVSLPDSLTSIGSGAFHWCRNLTLTSLPENVTTIGSYAFCSCQYVTMTILPDKVTTIGDNAFEGTCLGSMVIPASVKSIGDRAFCCEILEFVTVQGMTPASIGADSFLRETWINVELSVFQTYRSSWYNYVSQIQTIAPVTIAQEHASTVTSTGDHIITSSGFSVKFTADKGYSLTIPAVAIGTTTYDETQVSK